MRAPNIRPESPRHTHRPGKDHRARQRHKLAALGLEQNQVPERVFTDSIGGTLNGSYFSRTWHGLQAKANDPRAQLHDARQVMAVRAFESA